MASTALEEKINKIRLRNEEIKRRYEEVEADKKNAAKLDALVEPIPAEDWPERKEPPEFSGPTPKQINKLKHSIRKHSDQSSQYYAGTGDGKKSHTFADGQGPPPDPKYNFLADSEREEHGEQIPKDTERNRGRNKPIRGGFRRRGSGRDWHSKEQWGQQANPGDMTLPEYEAWRAERNRIDEARISRQRTAEGNWRREWDNDKVHLANDVSKRDNRVTLGDVVTRQEHGENEKHYRSPRTAPRSSHYANPRDSYHGTAVSEANKNHGTVSDPEKRVVIATEKSIKVLVNHGSTPPKSSVMSVKVSSPNIAGTGRVGPRQRPRVMYSSQSEAEAPIQESPTFARQKSVEDKTKSRQSDQTHKVTSPKSPNPQRCRDGDTKSPYPQRKDNDRADGSGKPVRKDAQKSPYPHRRGNASSSYPPKSPRVNIRSTESAKPKRNSENINMTTVRDAPKVEDIDSNADNSLDSSTAIIDNKSNEPLNHVECNDKKKYSVSLKESLFESTAIPIVEPVSESVNNDTENDNVEHPPLQESAASPAVELVLETAEDVGGTKEEFSEDSYGETSGTQIAKDSYAEDIDVESMDSQAINCSANSGLTSNDSGFIELPSNDSIHDVTEDDTIETSGIADTSAESLNFASHIAEDRVVIDNLQVEPKVIDEQIADAAKVSFNNLEIPSEPESVSADIAEKNKSKDATNITRDLELVKLKSQIEDAVTPAIVSEEADNNSNDTANAMANTESIRVESEEKDSSSLRGEADTMKDTDNSGSIQSESHSEEAGTLASIQADEADDNPQDVANVNANTPSSQLESQDKDLVEKSLEAAENTQEMKTTSDDESKAANDIVQEKKP